MLLKKASTALDEWWQLVLVLIEAPRTIAICYEGIFAADDE